MIIFLAIACFAQEKDCISREKSVPSSRLQILKHGVNIGRFLDGKLDNPDLSSLNTSTHSWDYSLSNLKTLTADHVRILIEPGQMFDPSSGALNQQNPSLKALDSLIDQLVRARLGVILALSIDEDKFHNRLATEPTLQKQFGRFWHDLAAHYSTAKDANSVFFETLNEPGSYDALFKTDFDKWSSLQTELIHAIRCGAPDSTILAVGAESSDINGLLALHPIAGDGNIAYVFHYYEPYSFTHQGEWWATGSYAQSLAGVPYPYSANEAQAATQKISSSLIDKRNALLDMVSARKERIDIDLEIAEEWGRQNSVIVLCDEFGVHRQQPDPHDHTRTVGASPEARAAWVHDVKDSLEKHRIGWTFWDYSSESFGLWSGKDKNKDDERVSGVLGFQLPK